MIFSDDSIKKILAGKKTIGSLILMKLGLMANTVLLVSEKLTE